MNINRGESEHLEGSGWPLLRREAGEGPGKGSRHIARESVNQRQWESGVGAAGFQLRDLDFGTTDAL